MKRKINFDLDFSNQDYLPKFNIKQFDNAMLDIRALNMNKPIILDDSIAKLFLAYKNDVYVQDENITIEEDRIQIDLDKNMLHTPSKVLGEIEITHADGTTTSTTFIFFITDKLGEGATVPGAMEGFVEKYYNLIQGVKEHTAYAINNIQYQAYESINRLEINAVNVNNEVKAESTKAIQDVKKEFTALSTQQQKELEVIEARDGEESLKLRLERDLAKGKLIEETQTGEYLTFHDTVNAPITLELHGNTIQNPINLADIESSGIDNRDGTYTYTVVACGSNLCKGVEMGYVNNSTGEFVPSSVNNRMSNLARVKPNSKYTFTKGNELRRTNKFFYDINRNFLFMGTDTEPIFTIPNNAYYIGLSFGTSEEVGDFMLKEVDGITPFEEFQETRIDIKLPFKIKNVKGVKDVLYYDELESAWSILRNITYLNYSELTDVGVAASLENCIQIHGTSKKEIKQYDSNGSTLITSKPFKHNFDDDEHMWIDSNTWRYKASIPKTIARTLDEVKTYLTKGELFMLFWDKNPEKIILPPSEQIKLNSLFDKTNIWVESGKVNATVKATVSKSLASAMQANTAEINNISKEIANINGLRETQDFEYYTDKSYQICNDTQVGVVKDLKIYGKSLVNLNQSKIKGYLDIAVTPRKITYNESTITYIASTTIGKEYTIVKYPSNRFVVGFAPSESIGTILTSAVNPIFDPNKTEVYKIVATDVKMLVYATQENKETNIVILEGDYTQNPPQYFEGIASVGNRNEIEVSSLKWDGNLFDDSILKPYIKSENDSEYVIDYGLIWYNKAKLVDLPFKSNTSYKFICTQKASDSTSKPRFYMHYTDGTEDQVTVGNIEWETVSATSRPNKTLEYISATYGSSGGNWTIKKNSICLYEDTSKSEYEPFKQDKKTILFKDTDNTWKPILNLRGIDENKCDILDSVNGKLFKKINEKTITGNDLLSIDVNINIEGYKAYKIELPNYKEDLGEDTIICDKYPCNVGRTEQKEGIYNRDSYSGKRTVTLRLPTSKANTIEEAKQYVNNNNFKVAYVMNIFEEYEINPIYPNSYENETMILIDGGSLPTKASFKITSSLTNTVKNQGTRISRMENEYFSKVTEMFKSVFNMDFRSLAYFLYPEEYIDGVTSEDKPTLLK